MAHAVNTFPNLQTSLKLRGESQQAFAERVGISQPMVSRLIRGERGASLKTALRVAKAAMVPIETLVGE